MKKIISLVRKMIKKYNLIVSGDVVGIGVSGGKDSLTLLTALNEIKKYGDIDFTLKAIAVDLSDGKMDYSPVEKYCQSLDVPFFKVNSNVFEIVFDIRKEKNPCSLCANMRRGLLNTKAVELGCNKVALAHHADDLIETFFMSLVFEGRLNVMQPSTYLSRTNLTVIRPMLLVEEDLIKNSSKNLPIIKNICPKDHFTEREKAKNTIIKLNSMYFGAKNNIFKALTNPERYNLWK